MSGTDFTTALARLLSDPDLMGQFFAEPDKTCDQLQLCAEDCLALKQLNRDDLLAQSQTLFKKRWHEIRRLVPHTIALQGKIAYELFNTYAADHWPTGHQRHRLDASGYINYLRQQKRSIDKAEHSRLNFYLGNKHVAFAVVRYPAAGAWGGRAIQVLTRFGKRHREYRVYLAGL